MDMLSLSHVSKSFGTKKVIDDLSFNVSEHKIYGFIGQNGSGKTTTMKMILGLFSADKGEITVNGEMVKYGQNKTNRFIGYLPDVPEFYGYMTPMEYLTLCGNITGMDLSRVKNAAGELLELVGLDKENKRILGFSRGMKQRLGIAQALLNSPKLLICDEPTSALDPIGRKEILDILLSVKDKTTVIFSTHVLSDVERICDEIGLLNNGKLALHGTKEEIRAMRKSDGFEVELSRPEDVDILAEKLLGGQRLGRTQIFYQGKSEEEMMKSMRILLENNLKIQRIEMREPTLETLFMEVVGK